MARKRARSALSSRSQTLRGPLPLLLLLAAFIIIGAMALDVPHGLWAQPGLAELRAAVLEAAGLQAPAATEAGQPAPEQAAAGWYQVYFTTPKYPDTAADHQGGIDGHLVQLIGQAQRTVDVAAYELDLETVGQALLAARQRGVAVRLVTDSDNVKEKVVQQLKAGGVPVVEDDRGAIMHNKYIIIDGQTVWTGSWNLTVNCTYRNNNNAIVIRSQDLARRYQAKFEEMFVQREFGPGRPSSPPPALTLQGARIESYFAPEDDVAERLVVLLGQAQHKIEFLAFSFTHDDIGQALIARARAGVAVSGVMEKRGSDTEYSEYAALRQAKVDVLLDGNPYVMHHKVFIIDDETVVTGSFNFTANADKDNDENLLIIHDREIARLYSQEYQRVRQRAQEAEQP